MGGIRFNYDPARARNAVAYILFKHSGQLDILKLVKLLFFADRLHLVKYGRPIVGGQYVAMPYGPVSSELYDELNEGTSAFRRIGKNKVVLTGRVEESELSESDIEVLSDIDREYGILDSFHLMEEAHK